MRPEWLLIGLAWADPPAETNPPAGVSAAVGRQAFADVARVLQSPRCMNCHPAGDAPLQGDASRSHTMQISRRVGEVGLACSTCHRPVAYDVPHLPPGNPAWHLAPATQVFEGLSVGALCRSLKDPKTNGGRDLDALLEHVTHDSLVLWGWSPGGGRTVPPLDHPTFVAAFRTWVAAGGPCP